MQVQAGSKPAGRFRSLIAMAALAACLVYGHAMAGMQAVKDLKYGVILFQFYQQKYFETLVEYAYAHDRGGIHNHGTYPELLKGGVSLSYGLDEQARHIFTRLIAENTSEEIQNRAWYYLAKMLYLRGDTAQAAETLSNVGGAMPGDIDQEYRYLAALINIKLGYFDEAESISAGFNKRSRYAPYLLFNLGVALGRQHEYGRAIDTLHKAAAYADDSAELDRLADRSHMAIAYLFSEDNKPVDAYDQINQVSTSGVFSNRALLGSGWSSVNSGDYREALAPLRVLEQRSMAIPEVQEAVLLVPHVYEKLGLTGRAARGFISAYERYGSTLEQLDNAREALKDAEVLELFVQNLDAMLEDSDWFGTAPSVSMNPLSPFLLDLMADHSFQSVLKDLRDLYAIRNNLEYWKRRRKDFDVMLESRSASLAGTDRQQQVEACTLQQAELATSFENLKQHVDRLTSDEQEQMRWLLDDMRNKIDRAGHLVNQLETPPGRTLETSDYAMLVNRNMDTLEDELSNTGKLIDKVEGVIIELVNAELDVHEERLKYYRVQSHLAKARILDSSLSDLEIPADDEQGPAPDSEPAQSQSAPQEQDIRG